MLIKLERWKMCVYKLRFVLVMLITENESEGVVEWRWSSIQNPEVLFPALPEFLEIQKREQDNSYEMRMLSGSGWR